MKRNFTPDDLLSGFLPFRESSTRESSFTVKLTVNWIIQKINLGDKTYSLNFLFATNFCENLATILLKN